jgi:transcriptional regulator with XRE-family HTH domain
MAERSSWEELRGRRLSEPGAADAYEAARLAYQLGAAVRDLREAKGWSQTQLAREAGMTQPAVARFEAGGTIPTLHVLQRLARALDANLTVTVTAHTDVRSSRSGLGRGGGVSDERDRSILDGGS